MLSANVTVRNVLVANVTEVFSGEKRGFGGTATNETAFAACASDLAEPVNEACYVGTLAQLFQNYVNGDLRAGNLCRNKGVLPDSVSATDLAGNPRIVGHAIDIGCYEAPNPCTLILFQ